MASNEEVLRKGMIKAKSIVSETIMASLISIGDAALVNAEKFHSYTHRTFNLSDSYGYAIYQKGILKKLKMNTPKAKKQDQQGTSGKDLGRSFLESYVSTEDWDLIVVAGEFYATALENQYNLDVLTGAYQATVEESESLFKKMPA